MTEYPTLTALMAGREPGSVKVLAKGDAPSKWLRPGARHNTGSWTCLGADGHTQRWCDEGPWLLVDDAPSSQAEDPPALDTLRLQIAAQVLASMHSANMDALPMSLRPEGGGSWDQRRAYALAEADALIAEARK